MRLPLDSEAADAYAVPQCQALCRPQWRWDTPHQCPYRARWQAGGRHLCGHHLAMAYRLSVPLVSDPDTTWQDALTVWQGMATATAT